MKILYVTRYYPWPATSGAKLRSARLIEQLASRHAVRAVALEPTPPGTGAAPVPVEFLPVQRTQAAVEQSRWRKRVAVARALFDHRPDVVRGYDTPAGRQSFSALKRLADESDAIWIEWPYIAALALVAGVKGRVVVDYVDLSATVQAGMVDKLPWSPYRVAKMVDTLKLRRFERHLSQQVWRAVVCKPEDVSALGGRNVFVVPNGTDTAPDYSADPVDTDTILFVGLMCYDPNIDAATWFSRECRPAVQSRLGRPVRFDVVGGEPTEAVLRLDDGKHVRVRGYANNLADWYRRAAVVVAPIRQGSGTKLKVLEALAYGKPLVATEEAVLGHGLRPDVDYLPADSPEEFASACTRLLQDSELRIRLGRSGRERILERHTWQRVGEIADQVVCG